MAACWIGVNVPVTGMSVWQHVGGDPGSPASARGRHGDAHLLEHTSRSTSEPGSSHSTG